jgi:hypothetical protein
MNRVDMTQAERRYAPSFQRGMVVQPEKDYAKAGLVPGEIYTVKEALPGNVLVLAASNGLSVSINPRKVTKLSVYQPEKPELAAGDLVRITRQIPSLDLTNGDRMRVTSLETGFIHLESLTQHDGKPERVVKLPSDKPLHLEHAYAATVHSAQGLTDDRVFVSINTESRTTSLNLFYVAISRARHEARIYADNIKKLPAAIGKRYEKTTSLSLQKEREALRKKLNRVRTTMVDSTPNQREFERTQSNSRKPLSDGISHTP